MRSAWVVGTHPILEQKGRYFGHLSLGGHQAVELGANLGPPLRLGSGLA